MARVLVLSFNSVPFDWVPGRRCRAAGDRTREEARQPRWTASGWLGERQMNALLRLWVTVRAAAVRPTGERRRGRRRRRQRGSRRQETSTENRRKPRPSYSRTAAALSSSTYRRTCPSPRAAQVRQPEVGERAAEAQALRVGVDAEHVDLADRLVADVPGRVDLVQCEAEQDAAVVGVPAPGEQEAGRVEPRLVLAQPQVLGGPAALLGVARRTPGRSPAARPASSRPGRKGRTRDVVGQRRAAGRGRRRRGPRRICSSTRARVKPCGGEQLRRTRAGRRAPRCSAGRAPASSSEPVEQGRAEAPPPVRAGARRAPRRRRRAGRSRRARRRPGPDVLPAGRPAVLQPELGLLGERPHAVGGRGGPQQREDVGDLARLEVVAQRGLRPVRRRLRSRAAAARAAAAVASATCWSSL